MEIAVDHSEPYALKLPLTTDESLWSKELDVPPSLPAVSMPDSAAMGI